jgi:predicted nucleic acid-binding protein
VTFYLDSSVALRVLLDQPARLPAWGRWERAFASELLGLEIRRALDRLRLRRLLEARDVAALLERTALIESAVDLVALTRTVLRRAALPMASPVRTLDALHLATALMIQERTEVTLVFATHDRQQAAAARALGFAVAGVPAAG